MDLKKKKIQLQISFKIINELYKVLVLPNKANCSAKVPRP